MRYASILRTGTLVLISVVATNLASASPPVPILGTKLKMGTVFEPHIRLETRGAISTDNTDNTSADPVLHGGSIRVFSTAGDVFDHTYPMPASLQWSYYGLVGQNRGYDYKDATHTNGPIVIVRVRNGKMTRVLGTGLDFSLQTNPNPVNIVLRLGDRKYCMVFGGEAFRFVPGKKYLSLRAPAPASCPGSPSGAFLDDAAF